jgi:hypothetical protein
MGCMRGQDKDQDSERVCVERLAPRYPLRASTAPHSLDGVFLPAYILRSARICCLVMRKFDVFSH